MENKEGQLELFKSPKLPEISFTKISVFLRCPKEYWHRFSERNATYDPQGQQILEGRLLHELARTYLRMPLLGRNSEQLKMHLHSESHLLAKIKRKKEIIEAVNMFDESCLKTLKNVQLEFPFKTRVGNFIFKGRVDCLASDQTGWTLFDFKLDDSELEHLRTDTDKYLQLIFYYFGLGLDKKPEPKDANLGYYFFLSGKIDSIKPSPSLLEKGLSRILEIYSQIKLARFFPAKTSIFCHSCIAGKKGVCSEYMSKRRDK